MNDSRDFQDAESVRSGHSHLASQPVFFPSFQSPGGIVLKECRAAKMGRQTFGTHIVYRDFFFFANPTASSSAPYPQELSP